MNNVTITTPEECAEFEKKYHAAAETLFDPLDSVENDLDDICALTEALRGSDMQRASALYPETAAAYRQACAAIGDLDTDA